MALPVIPLHAFKMLLVIEFRRFMKGVTRIIMPAASFPRVLDFPKHSAGAQTPPALRRIENRIDTRDGATPHVQKTRRQKPLTLIQPHLDVFARTDARLAAKILLQRLRRLLREPPSMRLKQPPPFVVDPRRPHAELEVRVAPQHPPLALGRRSI